MTKVHAKGTCQAFAYPKVQLFLYRDYYIGSDLT